MDTTVVRTTGEVYLFSYMFRIKNIFNSMFTKIPIKMEIFAPKNFPTG